MAALKLDMEKAYDRLEWDFILQTLRCFGFASVWVGWIEQCISTVSYSVMLNGSPYGLLHPERGLWQGDPLSPFLFIIASEVLSRLLLREEAIGSPHGVKVARAAPPISHLQFADDLMVFFRANRREATSVQHILELYSSWSGQKVNLSKLALFCSENTNPVVVEALCDML